jgi:hypothetical protein
MSHPWRPDLEHHTMKELYDMLPSGIQKGIDRIVWEKTKKLPEYGLVVEEKYKFNKSDILYMFPPLLPPAALLRFVGLGMYYSMSQGYIRY